MKKIKVKQESNALIANIGEEWGSIINNVQDELVYYVACVFDPSDIVEIRRLPSGKSTWHIAGELIDVVESLIQENKEKQHIYVGANPRRVRGGTRGRDVASAPCLFVDMDGIAVGEARDRWHNAGFPTPTITIASGHGVHAYWRFSEPIFDMDLWSKLQKRLIALLGSDGAIHDPARIMRLPGFSNYKEPVSTCRIIEHDQARIYHLSSLIALLYSVITEADYAAQYQAVHSNTRQSRKLFHNSFSVLERAKLIAAKWPRVAKGGRNCNAFKNSAYLLKNLSLPMEQAWLILQQWNLKNRPPLPEYELRQALRNANIYGRQAAGGRMRTWL